jgi:hypothetical protein
VKLLGAGSRKAAALLIQKEMPTNPTKSSTPAYTPWRHTSELAMVRDWFYPSQATIDPYSAPPSDMRQTAVQHVQMWSFKDPKLPHAVIATANLTEALLHDTLDRRRLISDWALRSVYAMAFCRFVNGLVDRDIAKAALTANAATKVDVSGGERTTNNKEGGAASTTSRGETSMYAHAAAIGLPEQFVDLRHRATHDDMPGLEVLRQAVRRALEWLWERWWKVYATDDPGRALREREEQRLLGERKREATRMSTSQEGVEAADRRGDHGLGTSGEQQRTNETPGDVGGDGITHGKPQDGKGSQLIYNSGVDAQRIIDGRSIKRPEKLAKTKLKHRPQSAFGLFEA